MDRNHRLDAPNNDSLQTIEQVDNRSELSTIYPNAQKEWSGEVMGETERLEKRNKESDAISISIRSLFALIGVLVPIPLVVFGLLIASVFTFINEDNAPIMAFPMMFVAFFCGLLSFLAIKKVYKIFYEHALKATPFIFILLFLLGICIQGAYSTLEPIFLTTPIYGVALASVVILVLSMLLSGILLFIWTTRRLNGIVKLGLIFIIALLLGGVVLSMTML